MTERQVRGAAGYYVYFAPGLPATALVVQAHEFHCRTFPFAPTAFTLILLIFHSGRVMWLSFILALNSMVLCTTKHK